MPLTPPPGLAEWRVDAAPYAYAARIKCDDGNTLASFYGRGAPDNARYVLTAAQVHPALVEALRSTLDMLEAAHRQIGIDHIPSPRIEKARAALALAESTP